MKKIESRSRNAPVLRAEIEERFRHKLNMTIFGANAMASAILAVFRRHLIAGSTIELRNVGKVETQIRAPRRHHMVTETPETRGTKSRMKMTPARRVLRFSPSQKLRARMLEHHNANNPDGQ